MFKKLNACGAESDKGFTVQTVNRCEALYTEENKTLTINYDTGQDKEGHYYDIILKSNFLKWDDGTKISPERQEEMIRNYVDAINFLGMKVKVYDD